MDEATPDVIMDDLILAALSRAECHRGYRGAPDWTMLEHLSVSRRSKKARQVRARLPELAAAGLLGQSRQSGIIQWALTAKGRGRLEEVPEVARFLPESPQHRRWREAHDDAEQEIEGFYLSLRDCADEAADLLGAPMPPGPTSDAWFEIGERLHRACKRLGSATHCLHEWAEPPEDKADHEERSEPSDAGLRVDERRRREARRAGRRDPRRWHDSQSTL